MLLGRLFSYHDTHLHRVGANAMELPVNRPKSPVNSYNRDGGLRHTNPADPVYAPNSYGGPVAAPQVFGGDASWHVDAGDIMRTSYVAHAEDDDFGQANAMVNTAMDDGARERLVANIVGHVKKGVEEPVLSRVFEYWRAVDKIIGDKVEDGIKG
jgi:catalase